MKKFLMIIVMLLSVIVANAQRTKGDLARDFGGGVFYLVMTDSTVVMFSSLDSDKVYKTDDGQVWNAMWKTIAPMEYHEKGAEEFIKLFERDKDVLWTVMEKNGLIFNFDTMVISEDRKSFQVEITNKFIMDLL